MPQKRTREVGGEDVGEKLGGGGLDLFACGAPRFLVCLYSYFLVGVFSWGCFQNWFEGLGDDDGVDFAVGVPAAEGEVLKFQTSSPK